MTGTLHLSGIAMTGINTPMGYFHEIVNMIPGTLDTAVKRLNEPIVIVFVILTLIVGFLTALSK